MIASEENFKEVKVSKNKSINFIIDGDNDTLLVSPAIKFNLFNFIPYLFNNMRTFWTVELEDEDALSFETFIESFLGENTNEDELYMCDCHEPSHFFILNNFEDEDEEDGYYIYTNITVSVCPLPFKLRVKQFFKTIFKKDVYSYHYNTSMHHIKQLTN